MYKQKSEAIDNRAKAKKKKNTDKKYTCIVQKTTKENGRSTLLMTQNIWRDQLPTITGLVLINYAIYVVNY